MGGLAGRRRGFSHDARRDAAPKDPPLRDNSPGDASRGVTLLTPLQRLGSVE